MFHGSLRDFLAGGTSSREKHLDKFYQFLSQGYQRLVCEGFCNSLAGQGPSCEKHLEKFSKIQVFRFLATQFGDLFASGSSNREVYSKCFAAPFATFSRVELLVTKNTQTNFSNFCLKVIGNLFMTHFSRENRVFCTIRVFFRTGFKKFSFSLASCDYSSSCPSFPLSKSSCSHTHSPFSSSLIH